MVNRVGGLASGMDIDALVAKLMAAEKTPLTKLQQKKQTTEWTRDAYRSVNTKLKTFDTYIADNLLLKGFNTKTATSSNSKYVTATATSSASGNLTIEGVSQLATAAKTVDSKQVNSNGGVATGSTKISDVEGSTFTGTGEYSILLKAIKSDGTLASEATEIKFKATDTIDDVMKKINSSNAGVTAFFENGKLSVAAKNTGALAGNAAEVQLVTEQTKNGVTVDATEGNKLFSLLGVGSSGSNALVEGGSNAIFRVNGIDTERSTNTFSMGGYNITLNETFNSKATIESRIKTLGELLDATNTAIPRLKDEIRDLTPIVDGAKADYDDALTMFNGANTNTALTAAGKKALATMNTAQLTTLENLDLTDNAAIDASDLTDAQKTTLKALKTEEKEALNNFTPAELKDLQKFSAYENLNSTSKNILSKMTATDIQELARITDLTSDTEIDASALTDEQKKALKSLSPEQRTILGNTSDADLTGMSKVINTKNAYDTINTDLTTKIQQLETNENNKIKYEKDLKEAEERLNSTPDFGASVPNVTLTSTTDVDDMMKKINEFVTTYNGLIKDLNDQTKDKKYRDYPPLTDEQRKEMSENEIKLWEEKAKSGLLRSDSILRSGLSDMRGLIYQSNPAVSNPKYNTLFNIGITTSKSYNDGGTLEIDQEKLRKALEDDPDAVTALFTNKGSEKETITVDGVEKTVDTRGFLQKLRGTMDTFSQNIEKKAGRASSADNSYTMGKSLVDMDKRIDTWKDKLEKIEARYWKQFSAMEQAINKANSQAGMFAQSGGQ
ncbi:flagellar filament capping protein FliD [Lysinibacillus xylanilyticus]|uniref:flagellar filament capping protein FliD n=1 Tax=Lysinibacillus xylanilyticus TaxID=582475 RepID=UPI003801A39E